MGMAWNLKRRWLDDPEQEVVMCRYRKSSRVDLTSLLQNGREKRETRANVRSYMS